MTEELLSLEEVANKLNCFVDKILRMGINGEIAISLPLNDGHIREYILPDDLKYLCNAFKGGKSVDPFYVALTPEAARSYEKNLDLESHEDGTRLAFNDYYGTTIEKLYISQEELERYINKGTNVDRDARLQLDAEKLANKWKSEGLKSFSKREVSNELAKSNEWREMTSPTIERILKKTW